MGRKRKNGEGTVRLRKDGRWEGRVVIGYDDKGLPKTKNVLAKTKSECVEKLKTLKDALAPPAPPRIKADMPFGDWMEHWYETHSRPAARPGTRRIYEAISGCTSTQDWSYPAEQADREGYAAVLRLAENGGACGPIGR